MCSRPLAASLAGGLAACLPGCLAACQPGCLPYGLLCSVLASATLPNPLRASVGAGAQPGRHAAPRVVSVILPITPTTPRHAAPAMGKVFVDRRDDGGAFKKRPGYFVTEIGMNNEIGRTIPGPSRNRARHQTGNILHSYLCDIDELQPHFYTFFDDIDETRARQCRPVEGTSYVNMPARNTGSGVSQLEITCPQISPETLLGVRTDFPFGARRSRGCLSPVENRGMCTCTRRRAI